MTTLATALTRARAPALLEPDPSRTPPIVAALDDSPASRAAIDAAIALAAERKAPLVFVYVRRGPAGYLGEPVYQRRLTNEMNDARRVLGRALDVARSAGVEAEGEILEGSPRRRILEFARSRGAQLVVVGSRRRRFGRDVGCAVARAADRPVVVARADVGVAIGVGTAPAPGTRAPHGRAIDTAVSATRTS